MVDITIITPLYNSEQYIFKCLDSLYNNYTETVEHLLVNDGSPGFTEDIAKTIREKYPKTVIIDKKTNEGIGYAYKDAISRATGKYIMFLDSDDTLSENSLESILKLIKDSDYDIIQFSGISVDDKGNILEKTSAADLEIKDKSSLWKYHFNTFKFPGLSLRAFKRELFSNLIFLQQNSGIDELLTAQLVFRAESLFSMSKEVYIRLTHADSVSQNRFSDKYLSFAYNVFREIYNSSIAKDSEFIGYWNDKYLSFVLHYYNSALIGKVDIPTEDVLSIMDYDSLYRRFCGFKGCYKNQPVRKISFCLFSHFRVIYNLIVKAINRVKGVKK